MSRYSNNRRFPVGLLHKFAFKVAEYRLEERNRDVSFWKKELQEETEAMKIEVDLLVESRRNIDHALAQTERPLRVYSKCK